MTMLMLYTAGLEMFLTRQENDLYWTFKSAIALLRKTFTSDLWL